AALRAGVSGVDSVGFVASRTGARAAGGRSGDRMHRRKALVLLVALALMAATAGLLERLRSHQRLGPPGVKTSPVPGSAIKVNVELPVQVLDCKSQRLETDPLVLDVLPADTSFGQRRY